MSNRNGDIIENDHVSEGESDYVSLGKQADSILSQGHDNLQDELPVEDPHEFPFCGSQMRKHQCKANEVAQIETGITTSFFLMTTYMQSLTVLEDRK